jgi:hypothetical protein
MSLTLTQIWGSELKLGKKIATAGVFALGIV